MSDLCKDPNYLKATLREALLDLNDRPSAPKSTLEVVRDSHVIEAVILLIAKVEALEKARE